MMLTSKMIIDIMEQIEREVSVSNIKDDEVARIYKWIKRWEILKQRIKNLGVLRNES